MAYRFQAPKVLRLCSKYVARKIQTLDSIILEVLEMAYNYDAAELKKSIVKYLMNKYVIRRFDCTLVYEYANRHKIEDLRAWLGVYASEVTVVNLADRLDFAEANNLPTLKTSIANNIGLWNRHQPIEGDKIISLMKTAFKHDVEPLKKYLLDNIQNSTEYHPDKGPYNQGISTNAFMKNYIDEVLALLSEIRNYIIKSYVIRSNTVNYYTSFNF